MADTADKTYGCADPTTARYALEALNVEDDVLSGVRARAQAAGLPDIHVSAADGRHLQVLALASGARKAVEVGTLAGYSGVCILRGMGGQGVLHTCELDPRHADVAKETFRLAGQQDRAHIHVGPAMDSLKQLASEGPFDFVFLDADKGGYPAYLEWAAEHLKVGGLVVADNVFLWGTIGRPNNDPGHGTPRELVEAMRGFNARVIGGDRFIGTLIPTGEGLAVGVKIR